MGGHSGWFRKRGTPSMLLEAVEVALIALAAAPPVCGSRNCGGGAVGVIEAGRRLVERCVAPIQVGTRGGSRRSTVRPSSAKFEDRSSRCFRSFHFSRHPFCAAIDFSTRFNAPSTPLTSSFRVLLFVAFLVATLHFPMRRHFSLKHISGHSCSRRSTIRVSSSPRCHTGED